MEHCNRQPCAVITVNYMYYELYYANILPFLSGKLSLKAKEIFIILNNAKVLKYWLDN